MLFRSPDKLLHIFDFLGDWASRQRCQRIFKDFTKAERIMSFNSPLMMVCVYASMILIAWMGAQQIVASGNNAAVGLTTGDLTALVTYAMQILMAMMMLSMIFIMVIISQASAERICQVLQEESTVTDPANPVTDMADGSIEFDHEIGRAHV